MQRIWQFVTHRNEGPTSQGLPPDLLLSDMQRRIRDPQRAALALAEIQRMEEWALLRVYLPAGWYVAQHRDFLVYHNEHYVAPSGESLTLDEWCKRWEAGTLPGFVAPMPGTLSGRPQITFEDVRRFIADEERASEAYQDLRHLLIWGFGNVYQEPCIDEWTVYVGKRLNPPDGVRLTLEAWCAKWLKYEAWLTAQVLADGEEAAL